MENKEHLQGSIPEKVSIEEGQQSARDCALNIVAAIEQAVGDLNRVKSIVKLLVYVSSSPNFHQQHLVQEHKKKLLYI